MTVEEVLRLANRWCNRCVYEEAVQEGITGPIDEAWRELREAVEQLAQEPVAAQSIVREGLDHSAWMYGENVA